MNILRLAVSASLAVSAFGFSSCKQRSSSSDEKGLKYQNANGNWDFYWVYSKSFGDIKKPENLHVCVYKATLTNSEYQGKEVTIFGHEQKLKEFWYAQDREVFRRRAQPFAAKYYNVEDLKKGFKVRNNELSSDPNAAKALGIFIKFRDWFFAEITQQRDFIAGNTGRTEDGGQRNDTLEYMDNASSFGQDATDDDVAKIGRNLSLILSQPKYSKPTGNDCPDVDTVLSRLPAK